MSTHNTLSRQWEMLKLLPPKAPGMSSAQLHRALQDAGYQVSKRTVERDLQELSRPFPLQCNDLGTPWGWHWMQDAALELPGLGLAEALSLAMVEEVLPTLLPHSLYNGLVPRFQQARRKLESLASENATARWLHKVASVRPELALQPPQSDPALLDSIQLALLEERQVRCRYYAAHRDKERELTLNPLALVQRGLITYLVATAEPYQDVRQYALHRFRQVESLDAPANGLDAFDLNAYLASDALQFSPNGKVQLQAWISDTLARLLQETPLSDDMTLEPQAEGQHLRAILSDSWQLRWWLLQQGPNLCVQAPEELRTFVRDSLQNTLVRYQEEQQDTHD